MSFTRAYKATTKPLQSHYTATTDPHTATLREQRSTSRPLFPISPKIKRRMHRQIQKFPTRGIRKCAASCKSSQRDGSENAPRVAKVPNERPPKTAREFQRRASRWQGECPRPPSTTEGAGGGQIYTMQIYIMQKYRQTGEDLVGGFDPDFTFVADITTCQKHVLGPHRRITIVNIGNLGI